MLYIAIGAFDFLPGLSREGPLHPQTGAPEARAQGAVLAELRRGLECPDRALQILGVLGLEIAVPQGYAQMVQIFRAMRGVQRGVLHSLVETRHGPLQVVQGRPLSIAGEQRCTEPAEPRGPGRRRRRRMCESARGRV